MSAAANLNLPAPSSWSDILDLPGQYVWVLIQSCDNRGNTTPQKLTISKTVSTRLSRSEYQQTIEEEAQEQSGSVTLSATVPVVSDVLSVSGGASSSWATSNWQQYTNQLQSSEEVSTTTSYTWNFEVGADSWSDFYRLDFVGPAGVVETDTTAVVPGGTQKLPENLMIKTKLTQQYSWWATPLVGGNGGYAFDDGVSHGIVTSLTVHYGGYVDNIAATYDDGSVIQHGGGGGDNEQTMKLDSNDPIASIVFHTGGFVDYFEVHFQSDKTYKFGGGGGDNHITCQVPKGYLLASLFGRGHGYVDAIQFLFTNRPPQKKKEIIATFHLK